MEKNADLLETLRRTGSDLGERARGAGKNIGAWYEALGPETRNMLLRGLAGGAAGGLITGGLASRIPRDPEHRTGVVGPALLGALLGGGTAAAMPAGLKLLKGQVKFPSEKRRSVTSRALDPLARFTVRHPAAIAGGIGATALAGRGQKDLAKAWQLAGKGKGTLRRLAGTFSKGGWKTQKTMAGIPLAIFSGLLLDKILRGEY